MRLLAFIAVLISPLCAVFQIHAAERFGGVEIGAKGIKASAVEVDATGAEATLKVLELDTKTVNVTISRLKDKDFKAVLVEDAADVVKDFVEVLKSELGVPDENIQVVASSGVPFAQNFADLVAAVHARTGKTLEQIDVVEEATLTAVALVPQRLRTRALVIDIGSGNTKGGAFLDESGTPSQFAPLDAPFGTATFAKAIDERMAAAPKTPRGTVAREAGRQLIGDRLREQLKAKPGLIERDQVFLAGGAVWAFATIMKPETALDPFVKVTPSEIRAYLDLLNKTPGKYPEVNSAGVADAAARKAAEDDYARIRGTSGKPPIFTPDGLQAGAVLLGQVSESLKFSNHAVRFDRKSVTAWITARITPAEYRHLLPAAFGRAIPVEGWPVEPFVAEVPDVKPPQAVQPNVTPKRVAPQTPATRPSTPLRPVPEPTPSVVGGSVPSQPGGTVPCGVVPMAHGGFFDGECGSCRADVGLRYVWPTIRFTTPRCDTCSDCSPCNSVSGITSRWSATCCVPRPAVCQTIVGSVETVSPLATNERSLPQVAVVRLVPTAQSRAESPSPETLVREYQKQGRSAGDLYVVGMSEFRRKNYAVAVSYFSAATLLTNDVRCWHFRGLCERELGRLTDAERSVAYGWRLTAADSESRSRAYLALEEVQGKRRAWLEGTKDSTNRTLTVQSSR